MTPRQIHALRERELEQMQREEILVGIIASTSANFSFCRPETPLSPELFMLHQLINTSEQQTAVTGEDVMAAFAQFR
jgi:hypothetical protein